MEHCPVIMAILQETRVESAAKVQDVLTKYGCNIRVRLGVHHAAVHECSNEGMIILQLCGKDLDVEQMKAELESIANVKVKYMTLDF